MRKTWFRTLIALLCAAALLVGLSGGAFAASSSRDYAWTVNADGTLTLTAYTGGASDLSLPAALDGKAVTAIGKGCFQGSLSLKRVRIPEGVTQIDDYAFECCSALEKIYLPDSLKEIGDGAFSGCASLTLADLQEGVERIGRGAFLCCDSLVQLELPAALEELGAFAFSGCGSLTTVRFHGDKVTALPDRLFFGCAALTQLRLPEGITEIGKRAFSGCEGLEHLYFGQPLTALGEAAFEGCAKLSSVSFAAETIPAKTFSGCSVLTYFGVAEGTRRIEALAFSGSGLSSVSLPASVEEIEAGAFFGIRESLDLDGENAAYILIDGSLYTADGKTLLAYFPADPYAETPQTELTVPEGVEVLASYALAESGLTRVVLPASLRRIEAYAFAGTELEDLEIPAGTQVDLDAFRYPGQSEEGETPEEPGEEIVPEIIGSVAGDRNLFRPEDYAGFKEIGNDEFDAWAQAYLAYNRAQGVPLETELMPYVIRYKGEVVPHYMPMTAVQNHDPAMWQEAANFFGDDFEQTYLMMDHGLFTELSRGKMEDDLILYSGLYDSQLMAAAGTDTLPTQAQLVNAIGTTFTDPIMISTTTDPAVACGFGDTLFIIYASRRAMEDLGAICIDAVTGSKEKEILMNANARYRILDVGNLAVETQEPWEEEPTTLYRGYVKVELLPAEAEKPVPARQFVDVPEGAYYSGPVAWAVSQGITKGVDKTHFDPEGVATRGQVMTFLWRAAGSPKAEVSKLTFTDVPKSMYYAEPIAWAVSQGITKGTGKTTFSPEQPCARGELVTFLHRLANRPAPKTQTNPFRDVTAKDYFYKAVLWAVDRGITKGTSKTTFGPAELCTRAQTVTFLFRYFNGE